jgi:inorganic pyrophosphatase
MANKKRRKNSKPVLLTGLPALDEATGNLNVVVETVKGSVYKYKYDPDGGVMRLTAVLPEGLAFPYDFGFIPSTRGEDGDPLDVLLLLDQSVAPGCVVPARLAGVIEIRQRARGKKTGSWTRNDRFLAVAIHGHVHQHITGPESFAPQLLEEIEAFFMHFARSSGRELDVLDRSGPGRAEKLMKQARAGRN